MLTLLFLLLLLLLLWLLTRLLLLNLLLTPLVLSRLLLLPLTMLSDRGGNVASPDRCRINERVASCRFNGDTSGERLFRCDGGDDDDSLVLDTRIRRVDVFGPSGSLREVKDNDNDDDDDDVDNDNNDGDVDESSWLG